MNPRIALALLLPGIIGGCLPRDVFEIPKEPNAASAIFVLHGEGERWVFVRDYPVQRPAAIGREGESETTLFLFDQSLGELGLVELSDQAAVSGSPIPTPQWTFQGVQGEWMVREDDRDLRQSTLLPIPALDTCGDREWGNGCFIGDDPVCKRPCPLQPTAPEPPAPPFPPMAPEDLRAVFDPASIVPPQCAGPWPENEPAGATRIFAGQPIAPSLAPGAVISLQAGLYSEDVLLPPDVALFGVCGQTSIGDVTGSERNHLEGLVAADVRLGGESTLHQVEFANLVVTSGTISGTALKGQSVIATGGALVSLEEVQLEGAQRAIEAIGATIAVSRGDLASTSVVVWVSEGGHLEFDQARLRGTRGLEAGAGSSAHLRILSIEESDVALFVLNARIHAEDLLVRSALNGIFADSSTVTLKRVRFEAVTRPAIYERGWMVIEDLQDVDPPADQLPIAIGAPRVDPPASFELYRATFDGRKPAVLSVRPLRLVATDVRAFGNDVPSFSMGVDQDATFEIGDLRFERLHLESGALFLGTGGSLTLTDLYIDGASRPEDLFEGFPLQIVNNRRQMLNRIQIVNAGLGGLLIDCEQRTELDKTVSISNLQVDWQGAAPRTFEGILMQDCRRMMLDRVALSGGLSSGIAIRNDEDPAIRTATVTNARIEGDTRMTFAMDTAGIDLLLEHFVLSSRDAGLNLGARRTPPLISKTTVRDGTISNSEIGIGVFGPRFFVPLEIFRDIRYVDVEDAISFDVGSAP